MSTQSSAKTTRPDATTSMSAMTKEEGALTERQRLFVSEYLKDFNGTAAAIRAGYSKDSARTYASQMLRNVAISGAVKEGLAGLLESNEVTAGRTIRQLAVIAFLDPASIYDEHGQLLAMNKMPAEIRHGIGGFELSRSITSTEGNTDGTTFGKITRTDTQKVRFVGRLQALIALAKHFDVLNSTHIPDKQHALDYLAQARADLAAMLEAASLASRPEEAEPTNGPQVSQHSASR